MCEITITTSSAPGGSDQRTKVAEESGRASRPAPRKQTRAELGRVLAGAGAHEPDPAGPAEPSGSCFEVALEHLLEQLGL